MCARLKTGINGVVHGIQAIWDKNLTAEDWGFLFVDAKNTFNEINQIGMLWTVCHLWPSGARFFVNCYRHWSSLDLRNRDGTDSFLYSREGVTQGDPLGTIA